MAMQLQQAVGGRNFLLLGTNALRSTIQYYSISGYKKPGMSITKDALRSTDKKEAHVTPIRQYPLAEPLPLPLNIEDIDAAEKARFSPQRSRDISGPVIMSKTVGTFGNGLSSRFNQQSHPADPHVTSYDCTGAVSLSSSMQTNVPDPFSPKDKSTHLNMPGGQWGQGFKYVSEDMQNSHYRNISHRRHDHDGPQGSDKSGTFIPGFLISRKPVMLLGKQVLFQTFMPYSTSMTNDDDNNNASLTNKEKLKRVVKEYGATVVVFHVGISLLSLGGFYLAVTSGLDMSQTLQSLGGGEMAAGASTFVIAYAIHKVFAPVRISITLASTPFIVRYLRKIGFLKQTKGTSS